MLPHNHRPFCDHARLHSSRQACSKHHNGPYTPTSFSLTELHTSFPCRASAGLQQPVTPGRGRRSAWSGGQPLACNETLQDSGDGFSGLSHSTHLQQNCDDSTAPAVPKKPRTGTVFVATFTMHGYIVWIYLHQTQGASSPCTGALPFTCCGQLHICSVSHTDDPALRVEEVKCEAHLCCLSVRCSGLCSLNTLSFVLQQQKAPKQTKA